MITDSERKNSFHIENLKLEYEINQAEKIDIQ